ncbi:multicopper oxidase family protein [Microlunatus sp. GCM10028923]|uniref:multicopper oxidase family protein n=1 Tax=Microlunatus sp. GCM10028923 TaxID=3273400 RepID=UPI00360F5F1C
MISSGLQLLILALAAGAAAGWAVATLRSSAGLGLALVAALAGTGLKIIGVVALWGHGWWFVGEKVIIGLPLTLVTAGWATVAAIRDARAGRPRSTPTRVALLAASYGAGADLLTQLLIGYPLTPAAGLAMIMMVLAATVISWVVLTRRADRRTISTVAAAGCLIMILVAAVPWPAAPTANAHSHGGHDHDHGPGAGDPPGDQVSVAELRTPASVAGRRVRITLEAAQQTVALPSGRTLEAWTYGSLPGPAIVAEQGDVIEVTLRNRDLTAGVTLHWHGYDVPNGEDGVPGVTQDAVRPGETFSYRFVAAQVGTYWYHTHQRSAGALRRGLFGTLVVHPRDRPRADVDLTLPFHSRGGIALLGATDTVRRQPVPTGRSVRLRLINTDQETRQFVVSGTDFRVAAIDGTDLAEPTPIRAELLRLPAGGRYDVTFTMPATPVRVGAVGFDSVGLILADPARPTAPADDPLQVTPSRTFDPLGYGSAAGAEPPPTGFTQERTVVLDRLPRWHDGGPALAYTMDGQVYPHVPATVVRRGDLVLFRIVNRGFETHPMHPHGHHVRVLRVNGRAPTGSPLWLDTFEVQPGEVWEVELRADNPGIWMDHCHNLEHATLGMMTHLVYEGVTSPYREGGTADNEPS